MSADKVSMQGEERCWGKGRAKWCVGEAHREGRDKEAGRGRSREGGCGWVTCEKFEPLALFEVY